MGKKKRADVKEVTNVNVYTVEVKKMNCKKISQTL
jgi:hypothetical protein